MGTLWPSYTLIPLLLPGVFLHLFLVLDPAKVFFSLTCEVEVEVDVGVEVEVEVEVQVDLLCRQERLCCQQEARWGEAG